MSATTEAEASPAPGAPTPALRAAEHVVNMPNGRERSRLWSGHRSRRREREGRFGVETVFTEADAWLVDEVTKLGVDVTS